MNLSEFVVKASKEIAKNGDKELMISVVFGDGKKLVGGMDNIKLVNNGNHFEIRGEQL